MTEALPPGLHQVPPGHVASVVTHLEMTAPPARRNGSRPPWQIGLIERPDPEMYLDLFRRIGAPWLWAGRLRLSLPDLDLILGDPAVEVHVLTVDGRPEGLAELDFRVEGACELAYFGVTPNLVGRGAGRALMALACDRAWSRPIRRFHVHTCTLDAPEALAFYQVSGFVPLRREIEISPDPRRDGGLPEDAAPKVPKL